MIQPGPYMIPCGSLLVSYPCRATRGATMGRAWPWATQAMPQLPVELPMWAHTDPKSHFGETINLYTKKNKSVREHSENQYFHCFWVILWISFSIFLIFCKVLGFLVDQNMCFSASPGKAMQNHLEISSTIQFWIRNMRNYIKTLTLDVSGPAKTCPWG